MVRARAPPIGAAQVRLRVVTVTTFGSHSAQKESRLGMAPETA